MIFVPCLGLVGGVVAECAQLGIPARVMTSGEPLHGLGHMHYAVADQTRVFVGVYDCIESRATGFREFVRGLHERGLMNRIVIDEVHSVFESASFRGIMGTLAHVRQGTGDIPLTLMSGTLTQSMWAALDQVFKLVAPVSVEADDKQLIERLIAVYDEIHDCRQHPRRVAFFMQSKDLVRRVPDTRVMETTSETRKADFEEICAEVVSGDAQVVLVSTSVMASGVNFKEFSDVVVVGGYSLPEMAQMSGRAGRGGGKDSKDSKVWLLCPRTVRQMSTEESQGALGDLGVAEVDKVVAAITTRRVVEFFTEANEKCAAELLEKEFAVGGEAASSTSCGQCTFCKLGSVGVPVLVERQKRVQAATGVTRKQQRIAAAAEEEETKLEGLFLGYQKLVTEVSGQGIAQCLVCETTMTGREDQSERGARGVQLLFQHGALCA